MLFRQRDRCYADAADDMSIGSRSSRRFVYLTVSVVSP